MPKCPKDARCELVCSGREACQGLQNIPNGQAGSIVDVDGGTSLPEQAVPNVASLSSKIVAFRVKVRRYKWPPKVKGCKGASKSSWYCPGVLGPKSVRNQSANVVDRW